MRGRGETCRPLSSIEVTARPGRGHSGRVVFPFPPFDQTEVGKSAKGRADRDPRRAGHGVRPARRGRQEHATGEGKGGQGEGEQGGRIPTGPRSSVLSLAGMPFERAGLCRKQTAGTGPQSIFLFPPEIGPAPGPPSRKLGPSPGKGRSPVPPWGRVSSRAGRGRPGKPLSLSPASPGSALSS